MLADGIRRELFCEKPHIVESVDVIGDSAEIRCDKALFEQHVHDGEEQGAVGAWSRRDVPVGQFSRAGTGRVDHGQPAATLAQCP